jgi:hypothetical protein
MFPGFHSLGVDTSSDQNLVVHSGRKDFVEREPKSANIQIPEKYRYAGELIEK